VPDESPAAGHPHRTLIRNGFVVTMDDDLGTCPATDVLIGEDGHIAAVGQSLSPDGVDETVDATDSLVMPGFVDSHRHMYSGLARGTGDGLSYGDYFGEVILDYAQSYTPDDTYVAVRLGAAEAIESGITTMHAWEHNLLTPDHAAQSLKALTDSGLRGRFSYGPPNVPMTLNPDHVLRLRSAAFTRSPDGRYVTPDGRIDLGIACRGIELSDESIWRPELEFARSEHLAITGHLMAASQIDDLHRAGFLGPDLLGVHAIDAGKSQAKMLGETGTPVSISHGGNGRAGVGWSDPTLLRDAGVKLCISLDSLSGCDTGDFFALMRLIVVATRALARNPAAYPVTAMLRDATICGAEALGIGDRTGSLVPGKRADLIVLRTDTLNMTPLANPVAQIVLSAQPRNVHHVWIDGIRRLDAGQLTGKPAAEIVSDGRQHFEQIAGRRGRRVL